MKLSKRFKNLIYVLILAFIDQILFAGNIMGSKILWPSAMNLQNENLNLDDILPETATSSESRKGFLLTSDPREVFTLGAGNVAINVTLSGLGHTHMQLLQGLKKRGIKITIILCNDKPTIGVNTKDAPPEYQNPFFYMIDFHAINGEWQKYNFDRIVEDYGDYVDNWILGNEINCQLYNYYGPSDIEPYTKVYCDTFKICYEKIKEKNPDADVYISFDQIWDMPSQRKGSNKYDSISGPYRYNAKEQLSIINKYLGRNIDWGIAIHPYPTPIESSKFWDDEYSGYDEYAKDEIDRPYLSTLKNLDYVVYYLSQKTFLKKNNEVRNIIISEFGLSSNSGERIQAAALYYLWEKIKDNPAIKCFLYNAQTDLDDNKFGLTDKKGHRRLAWAVFKDMDREYESAWCKDLLDAVLKENDFASINGYIIPLASLSELQ